MKILAVADLRTQPTSLLARVVAREQPDVIVYAGDSVRRFRAGPESWADVALLAPHGLCGVLGNECAPDDADAFDQAGCQDLGRAPLVVAGLAFIGLPGAPSDEGEKAGAVLYSRASARAHLQSQLDEVGDQPFVVVSHSPPHGVLDTAAWAGAPSVGSSVVREFLTHPRCRAVIAGRVQAQRGRSKRVDGCTVINVASDHTPGSALLFAVLRLSGGEVDVAFGEEREYHELTRLPGIAQGRAAQLASAGIRTWDDILRDPDGAVASVLGRDGAARLRLQVAAFLDGSARATGAGRPITNDALYLGIDTAHDRNDQPWMIGMCGPGDTSVTQLFQPDPAAQGQQLDALDAAVQGFGCSAVVCWGAASRTVLRQSFTLHRRRVPDWVTGGVEWVDASRWVTAALVLPLEAAQLRVVAPWAGFHFGYANVTALDIGMMYARHRDLGEPLDDLLVRAFNREGVLALRHVVTHVNRMLV